VAAAFGARHDQLGVLAGLASLEQPVVASRFGLPVLIVFDPAAARQVLVTDAGSYSRPWPVTRIMREGLGENLFTADEKAGAERRRVVAPIFARSHGDELAQVMASTIADEISRWQPGRAEDIQSDLTDLTLRVASRALLGTDTAEDEVGRALREQFEVVLGWISHRFSHIASPPAVVPTRRNRAMTEARCELKAIVRRLIAERRQSDIATADVLGRLLQSQADPGGGPTDEAIIQECIGFLFAGHETTASTLTWAVYSLAVAPDVQERVAREGDRLVSGIPRLVDDIEGLAYTGRVVEEILRLYPAGIGIARMARRTTELCGQRVRRGTLVGIAVYSIQRDGRVWPGPETFNPDRFLPSDRTETDPIAHLPFGWGPRRCLGARFATTEARLALAMTCSEWTLTYHEPNPPQPAITPSLRVDGALPLRLERRRRPGGTTVN
jgi:cytochrome P450